MRARKQEREQSIVNDCDIADGRNGASDAISSDSSFAYDPSYIKANAWKKR